MKRKMTATTLFTVLCAGYLAGCGSQVDETPVEEVKKGGFTVSASVHDPSIVVGEDGKYYIFGSHMEAAESEDLREWKSFASGVDADNPLFDNLFDGVEDGDPAAFSYVGRNDGYLCLYRRKRFKELHNDRAVQPFRVPQLHRPDGIL